MDDGDCKVGNSFNFFAHYTYRTFLWKFYLISTSSDSFYALFFFFLPSEWISWVMTWSSTLLRGLLLIACIIYSVSWERTKGMQAFTGPLRSQEPLVIMLSSCSLIWTRPLKVSGSCTVCGTLVITCSAFSGVWWVKPQVHGSTEVVKIEYHSDRELLLEQRVFHKSPIEFWQ